MDMAVVTVVSDCVCMYVGNEWTPESWQGMRNLGGDQHSSNGKGTVEVAGLGIATSIYTPGEVNGPAFAMRRTCASEQASNYVR